MSTPTTPDDPAEEHDVTPAEAATEQQPVAPPSGAAASAPPYGPPAWQPPYPPYPPHQPYVGGPFAPRVREPWINPVKRGALAAAAIVLALVLFGGGIVVGAVVADDHGGSHPGLGPLDNHRARGFGGGNAGRPGLGPHPGVGRRPGFGPGHLPRPGTPSSAVPSPTPSTSHS